MDGLVEVEFVVAGFAVVVVLEVLLEVGDVDDLAVLEGGVVHGGGEGFGVGVAAVACGCTIRICVVVLQVFDMMRESGESM